MEKFVLPEKWWIKATNDAEDAVIVEYINTKFHTFISSGIGTMSYWCYANYSLEDGYNKYDAGIDNISGFDGVTQLTYDQFIRYVINKTIDIPEEQPEDNTELNQILIKLLTE